MTTATRYAPPAPAVTYPSGERVEAALALALGVKPGTAHQLMYGRESVFDRAELIVTTLIRLGRRARAERLCRNLLQLLSSLPPVAFSDALVIREAGAAAAVEVARAAYQAAETRESLAAFERAVRLHEAVERELDTAAARELEA